MALGRSSPPGQGAHEWWGGPEAMRLGHAGEPGHGSAQLQPLQQPLEPLCSPGTEPEAPGWPPSPARAGLTWTSPGGSAGRDGRGSEGVGGGLPAGRW